MSDHARLYRQDPPAPVRGSESLVPEPAAGQRQRVSPGESGAGIWRKSLGTFAAGAVLPVSLLVLWQVLGDLGYISELLFPTPLRIAESFAHLAGSGDLGGHVRISLVRAAAGFALGGALGLAFGILVGVFRISERVLDPSFQMVRMIPHLAVAPLFVLWFGIGESSKILLIAKGAFFPLYIQTYLGIRGVDNKWFEVTRVLGFTRIQQIYRLVIPSSLPHIFLGIRLSLGLAWLGLVVAEIMGSTSGIGYLMTDARQFGKTATVFVCIVLFAVIGKAADAAVRLLERRLLKWNDSYEG
ncbi:MAG: ABC transporter permease [Paenibacillus lautus]|uniref:ABC transporter permease n=1 Tax=Paenibacillus lautus TaxID=1401 RepID=UPI0010ED0562|nr:ABC transporter permease [Paenibacillus lautus]MCI1772460.1 ABC transporter permease [Paenibacillus lautus]VTR60381.1 ABC transporter permease [Actinobacillus pleuropneumoniae]